MHEQLSLQRQVTDIVEATPAFDIHTHLYDPAFGGLLLWGIDELLVYHYLVAEGFRHFDLPYEKFWAAARIPGSIKPLPRKRSRVAVRPCGQGNRRTLSSPVNFKLQSSIRSHRI